MSEQSLAQPARASTPPKPEVIAERVEEELARLREARPHLADRLDRASNILVCHLSSPPRSRPIRCRVRANGHPVLLISSLTTAGTVYVVDPGDWSCSCPDFHRRRQACKHAICGWIISRASLTRETAGHTDRCGEIVGKTGAAREQIQEVAGGDADKEAPLTVPGVYTARYAASSLLSSGALVPVRISMFPPIIPLGYGLAEEVRDLEPDRSMLGEWDRYSTGYWKKLDAIGSERIARQLWAISERHGGKPLALLCYEDLTSGDKCHRAVLAFWWYEQTGLEMPEITDDGELLGLHDLHRQTMPVVPRSVVPR